MHQVDFAALAVMTIAVGCTMFGAVPEASSSRLTVPETRPAPPAKRTLELGDQTLKLKTVYEDDFSKDTGDWIVEGAAAKVHEGRLVMNAVSGEPHFATVWCKKPFKGDTVIEYTVRVEKGKGTNINFFVYGSEPDGSSVLKTSKSRSGSYGEYHKINNYIYTFLNSRKGDKKQARVRFRKDPGFKLIKEAWLDPIKKGRDYRLTIVIQAARMRFYVDGRLVVDHRDEEKPHRKGHHAFRTWRTHMSADVFRVSRIVEAKEKKSKA